MTEIVECIVDYACHTGENPIWHSDEQVLYWLDIPQGRIFRYDPATDTSEIYYEGDVIGGMTIQEDGALLLFMAEGRVAMLQDGRLTDVISHLDAETGKRFNDVIATPTGNVFCGTLSEQGETGSLYHLDRDGAIRKVIDPVGIANGMGFSPDYAYFYFTDSTPARKIYRYRYNRANEHLSDVHVLVQPLEQYGLPDGMTVDIAGYLWSAFWDGARVVRYKPSGIIDHEIQLPTAQQVSSVTFGGPDYTDMYITTAGGDDKAKNGPDAGALFRCRLEGVQGRPEHRSKIGIPS
ncbi:MAG: SMP-30/gluconolactonase/LRE family protein [Chloroflexota bacterium]